MKAITKDGRTFEVRFQKVDVDRFGHLFCRQKHWDQNNTEILINGKWFASETVRGYVEKEEVPGIWLFQGAEKVLGIDDEWLRIPFIRLDKEPKEEWEKFYKDTEKTFQEEANKASFTKIIIRHHGDEFYIEDWDSPMNKEYARFNTEASKMFLSFSLADQANEKFMFRYAKRPEDTSQHSFVWTISKDDMEIIDKIAEPMREEYERKKKKEAWLDERIEKMGKNIAEGAIYFRCESAPHEEDLSKLILTRPCPNEGSFILCQRVSKDIFALIKRFGVYYDAEFLEDCDMFNSDTGWRFTYQAIDTLRKLGYRVFVDYVEIE